MTARTMSPEAQRIAIAEACGWHSFREIPSGPKDEATRLWGHPAELKRTALPTELVPDYLNDLNAMHEAEEVLEDPDEKGRLMATYAVWKMPSVCEVYTKGVSAHAGFTGGYWMIHATAAQRAEAFLRTLGKWTEA